MRISKLVIILFFLSCSTSTEEERDPVQYDPHKPLKSFLNDIREYYQLPGIAAVLIRGDSISLLAVVGKNKTANGADLNEYSKFQIASCAKSFTSLLTGIFVDERRISWDTGLADVFPEWKHSINEQYKSVTVRQLLSHTAGVPPFSSDEAFFRISKVFPDLKGNLPAQREVFARRILTGTPANDTGTFNYSNAGYVIAAAILERLSGKSYEDLLQKKIFDPLKLRSASCGYAFYLDKHQPWRHMFRDGDGTAITLDMEARKIPGIFNPAGNISLSAGDMAKYILMHVRALNGRETVINHKIIVETHKAIIKRPDEGDAYAMGWTVRTFLGHKTSGHGGSDKTIRSLMVIDHETQKAVVVLTNIGDRRAEIATINVAAELLK